MEICVRKVLSPKYGSEEGLNVFRTLIYQFDFCLVFLVCTKLEKPKLAIIVAYLLLVSKHLDIDHLQYNSIVAGVTVYQ